jgi:hypothetical protein
VNFKITGNPISKAKFTIGAVAYTGSAVKPSYSLTYPIVGNLTEGKDYTVTISNNIKKGKGTIIFKGIGRFKGTAKKTFNINPLGLSGNVTLVCGGSSSSAAIGKLGAYAYTKGGVKPETQLIYNGRVLREGTDYKVKYANNNAEGSADAAKAPTLTVTGTGNFGGSLTRTFTIQKSELSNTTVVVNDLVATGKAGSFKPSLTVIDSNGNKLAAGKDYDKKSIEYTYTSSVNVIRKTGNKIETIPVTDRTKVEANDIIPAGTELRATVYGKGLYDGYKEGHFRYVDVLLNKAAVKLNKTVYDFNITEDDLTVKLSGNDVPKGAYRITSIIQNTKNGTAKLTITGVGKVGDMYYGGSKTITIKLKARVIE